MILSRRVPVARRSPPRLPTGASRIDRNNDERTEHEMINLDPEAFERRVREHCYLRSMAGNRKVTIIKG